MLTVQENRRLTQVGPGTPMGVLMRRYWHPIAGSAELVQRPTREVRLLGEDLVLYRDKGGRLGLIGARCAHRSVRLVHGVAEPEGLRCPYHGWMYDATGQCIEMPAEAPDSTFKDRVRLPAYPVQELGGLIFAYLGPAPAPLLPRWDLLVHDNALRTIGVTVLPCNWLQCMENSLDPVHLEWLHGRYYMDVLERQGKSPDYARGAFRRHRKIGFDLFEYGIVKRRVVEGGSEEDLDWRVGHPILFPNILRQGGGGRDSFQWRVPMDDTHTYHVDYNVFFPAPGHRAPQADVVPIHQVPIYDEAGELFTDSVISQDYMVWLDQGDVADRSVEKLAESDKGIILYRRLLREQMSIVEDGGDPMCTFRDPATNQRVEIAQEEMNYTGGARRLFLNGSEARLRFGPRISEIEQVMATYEQAAPV